MNDYVIVGGGMTADSAARGIRESDPQAKIKIIGSELDPPYERPPLTKGLWTGKSIDDIWRNTEETGVELLLGRTIERVVPDKQVVVDDQRTEHPYGKLLLATGASPRKLGFKSGRIVYYRTIADYRHIREQVLKGGRAIVIGGGFIGAEITAALTMNNIQVSMVFPERGINAGIFPKGLSDKITAYYRDKGVEIHSGVKPSEIEDEDGDFRAVLEDGEIIEADFAIAGIGVEPNTKLASDAGLDVDDGILVDSQCRTSNPDIFAAGDCARFHSSLLAADMRVEHEDNANTMGKAAGRCMAGEEMGYDYLPMFYSDLFDLGYEAIGNTDSALETIEFWKDDDYGKGIVFYADGQDLCGAVFWNVWDMVDKFKELLKESQSADRGRLKDWVAANS